MALQTDYVPLRHMSLESERLINAFYSFPFSPLSTRRPRIAYGSSIVHDTNDPIPACGIDGFHKFLIFPLATPTRTSLVSFEPLLPPAYLPLSLLFILLFCGRTVAPCELWLVPETSRTVVFGRRFVGFVELMV